MGGDERPQGHEEGGGGDEIEGWSGESGGSDATSDMGSEEGEEEHALLTASPWGMQESGARGLRVGARAAMKRKNNTAGKRVAAGVGSVQTPGEWEETLGAARPPEWTPIPTEWNGRKGSQGLRSE